MATSALKLKRHKPHNKAEAMTDADVKRVLRLLKSAQFSLGRKTDSVKLIREERR